MPRFAALLILVAACAEAQTVEGSVLDAATGAGIPDVKVELLRGTTPFYETATDAGGRFRFDNIREADYAARYQSPEYWSTAGPSDYKPFHVGAATPTKLEARLMPWSRISGRVIDSQGDPVPGARVELTGSGMLMGNRIYLRTSWGGGGGMQLGDSTLRMTFFGITDDHGTFEVQLMPGSYELSVLPPLDLKPPAPEPDGPALAWKRAEVPSNIVVLPGGEVANVELKLLAVPAHAVRGVVLNPDGTPAPKVSIFIPLDVRGPSVFSGPDGAFEFAAVPEGEWRVTARIERDKVRLSAGEWIDVPKHDVENVKLRLGAPLSVRGKAVVEAPAGSPLPRMMPLMLALRGGHGQREGDLGPMPAIATFDATGNFVADVYPGLYGISPLTQAPPLPYYMDAIRANGADLNTQDMEFASEGIAITVVYKSDGGSVHGAAENCASGGVLLIPQDPLLRRRFSRSGACDSSDRYEVVAIRPGEYYALAFAGNGPVPPVDEALLNQAVKVTVRAATPSSADVKAVTRPIY